MKGLNGKWTAGLLVTATGFLFMGAAACASADSNDDHAPPLLALGDSVAFGYITHDGFAYRNPSNFIGYSAYVGNALRLHVVNAACPGETSGSFISGTLPDNGCQAFRNQSPLHVAYTGSQLAFATSFLKAHRNTRVVTVGLGANDLLVLLASCESDVSCVEGGLPAVLAGVLSNMETILGSLRQTGFHGRLVVVNYYSPDYTDLVRTRALAALNQVLAAVAAPFDGVVADAFTAFQAAASIPSAGGNTCMAGLLNVDPQNQLLCDIHPAQSGQRLISRTVLTATGLGKD